MHCPDFQHEGAACKIFTCCQLVNKRPLLACWDQSKLWSKDMKASDSMWRVGGGWGVYVCVCVCDYACVHFLLVFAYYLSNKPVPKKSQEHHVAPRWSQEPRGLYCCICFRQMKKTWQFSTPQSRTWKHARVMWQCLIPSLGFLKKMHTLVSPRNKKQPLTTKRIFMFNI